MKTFTKTAIREANGWLRESNGNAFAALHQLDLQREAIRPYTARNLEAAGEVLRWLVRPEEEARRAKRLENMRALVERLKDARS
jgi:hypothetical protein